MKAHSISTDNANVSKKVHLRKEATKDIDGLKVLDLFAGNNILWSHFDCVRYYGVEKEKGKGSNLAADNLRVIASLDLSGFNVIDADSYGIPFNQMVALFQNNTLRPGTVIIYTCITSKMSAINKACLRHFNLDKIYSKCKVLVNGKLAKDFFYGYLYEKGIRHVYKYSEKASFDKDYGYFFVT